MANLARMRVAWSGAGVVGPGVTTLYFDEAASGFTAAVKTFFTAVQGRVPVSVTWTVPNTGDLVDVATGDITGTWTDGTAGTIAGTGTPAFSHGVGGRIVWGTAGRTNNRLVHGTTFLVPLTNAQFTTSGDIDPAAGAAIEAAALTLSTAAGGSLRIWSKPRTGVTGAAHATTSVKVPLIPAWLRSRKT